jgi:hypothetical protein
VNAPTTKKVKLSLKGYTKKTAAKDADKGSEDDHKSGSDKQQQQEALEPTASTPTQETFTGPPGKHIDCAAGPEDDLFDWEDWEAEQELTQENPTEQELTQETPTELEIALTPGRDLNSTHKELLSLQFTHSDLLDNFAAGSLENELLEKELANLKSRHARLIKENAERKKTEHSNSLNYVSLQKALQDLKTVEVTKKKLAGTIKSEADRADKAEEALKRSQEALKRTQKVLQQTKEELKHDKDARSRAIVKPLKDLTESRNALQQLYDNQTACVESIIKKLQYYGRKERETDYFEDVSPVDNKNTVFKPYTFFPWILRSIVTANYGQFEHRSRKGYWDERGLEAAVAAEQAY